MRRRTLIVLLVVTLAGCAGPTAIGLPPAGDRHHGQYLLTAVPFFPQQAYQCGPAALAMALSWSGVPITPQELVPEVFTPSKKGSLQPAVVAAARRHDRIAYLLTDPRSLSDEISAGHPVVVLQNLGLSWYPVWHFAVVVGLDFTDGAVIMHSGTTPRKRTSFKTFAYTWSRSDYWGLLVMPPWQLPAVATEGHVLRSVGHLERLGKWQAAAEGYRAALRRWPDSLIATVGLGVCLYRSGDLVAAEAHFRDATFRFPHEGVVYNNLAHVLMEMGKNAEAAEAALKAVDIGGPLKADYERTLEEIQMR
ncbi:MAG: PA2778 family cysteine peptidase [Desulfobacteraceae bacterium]|nr:PA2778 family cysteine peptidase [Desulfobacteraceae bacterium]